MSQTIILELSEFDAALLSELSKREAKTPEELILEALHGLFASRLDDKIIPLSPDVFDACSKIIFEPEKCLKKEVRLFLAGQLTINWLEQRLEDLVFQ